MNISSDGGSTHFLDDTGTTRYIDEKYEEMS